MTSFNSRLAKIYAGLTPSEQAVLMYEAVCEGRGEVDIPIIRKSLRWWQINEFRRNSSVAVGIFNVVGLHAVDVRREVELLMEKRILLYVLASWGVERPADNPRSKPIDESEARSIIKLRWEDWAGVCTEQMFAAVEEVIDADTSRFDEAFNAGTFGEPFRPDAFSRWLGEPLATGPSHPAQLFLGHPQIGGWDVFIGQTLDELADGAYYAGARLEAVKLVLDERLKALGSKTVHPVLEETLRWSFDQLIELHKLLGALGRTCDRPAADEETAEQIRQGVAAVRL